MPISPPTGVVAFDYATFLIQYPEFGGYVTEPQANFYFNRAQTEFCDNTPCSPVLALPPTQNGPFRLQVMLYQVTAHFAALFAIKSGNAPPGLVGRINSATQGSVTVQSSYTEPGTDLQAFFNQTPYGAAFLAAATPINTGFYVPAPQYSGRLAGRGGPAGQPYWPFPIGRGRGW